MLALFVFVTLGCAKKAAEQAAPPNGREMILLANSLLIQARGPDISAIGSDGKIKWTLKLAANEVVVGKLAAAANSTVYVRTSSALRALSPTGEWLWTVPLAGPHGDAVPYSPAAMTDSSAVVLVEGQTYRNYTRAGEIRWEVALDSSEQPRSPPLVAADGQLYVGTDQSLYAIAPVGKISWRLAR